jgi:DNA polymerase-3 subunit delta
MVALKAAEVDSFVARPSPERPIVLVCGPDAGLVHERAEKIIRASVDDPNDPFALVRIEGDALASDPSRLVEEAHTVPLFGGRRAVWVKAGGRNFAAAVEAVVASPPTECRIVIEAGDLRRNAPVRAICEKAKCAAVLPCYVDTERDLIRLVDDEMRDARLTIAPDARAALVSLIGGDRQASRSEIRKLALYAHGKGEVTLDDVMAVVSDASDLKLDPIVDAAFAGNAAIVESEFAKAMVAGTYPGIIISAAQRQAAWLHKSALALAGGSPLSSVLDGGFPRLHFSRKATVETALRNFSPPRLVGIIDQLATSALDMRKQAALAAAIAQRTLLAIAANAKRRC